MFSSRRDYPVRPAAVMETDMEVRRQTPRAVRQLPDSVSHNRRRGGPHYRRRGQRRPSEMRPASVSCALGVDCVSSASEGARDLTLRGPRTQALAEDTSRPSHELPPRRSVAPTDLTKCLDDRGTAASGVPDPVRHLSGGGAFASRVSAFAIVIGV